MKSKKERLPVLIPAMLDAHFPLMKYAFYSKKYRPVILNNEKGITDVGLHYVNNEMCYPAVLNIGQLLAALQSGHFDTAKTKVLMPTAGDACRGSNYTAVLKRALSNAGLSEVGVLSLNVMGIDRDSAYGLEPLMVWRALFALFYGDILMLLLAQTRPYEKEKGAAKQLWEQWTARLGKELRTPARLTLGQMKQNFSRICADFASLQKTGERKQRVGIVGELYTKYCHLGNWDLVRFLEEQGCESHTNGLSWYVLYYMDSHKKSAQTAEKMAFEVVSRLVGSLQNVMVQTLRGYGFYSMEPFSVLKSEAAEYVSYDMCMGDGWLIGAEIVGHALHDCRKVVAVQPFGCMPNHCCGRGLYPALQRKLSKAMLVSVDVDASGSRGNYYNRVKMLVDWPLKTP